MLIHVDAGRLGQHGGTLLTGLLARLLFATAMRQTSPRQRVTLCLDELPRIAHLVAEDLEQIVSLARSQSLQLLLACQFVSQLPDRLAKSLTKQTAVQGHFRTDYEDARSLAAALLAGSTPPLAQVVLAPDQQRRDEALPMRVWTHPLRDSAGRAMRVTRGLWPQIAPPPATPHLPLATITALARRLKPPRFYILEPGTNRPVELMAYLRTVRSGRVCFDGPALTLSVEYPRVKPTRVSFLSDSDLLGQATQTLQTLPLRSALVRVDNQVLGVVRIADVPGVHFGPEHERYLAEILRINGQSSESILATLEQCAQERAALVRNGPQHRSKGAQDGSQW